MNRFNIKWKLVVYDLLSFTVVSAFMCFTSQSLRSAERTIVAEQLLITAGCVLLARFIGGVYQQIWRYGGIQCYLRLVVTDGVAYLINVLVALIVSRYRLAFSDTLLLVCLNLLNTLVMRMVYRYAYKSCITPTAVGNFSKKLLRVFAGQSTELPGDDVQKIKVAIIGAGRVGVFLAEEMLGNTSSPYIPRCFIDIKKEKVGRTIHGIPVFPENQATFEQLKKHEIQEIVLAIPNLTEIEKRNLYNNYTKVGMKMKVYDYPVMQTAGSKRQLRDFDVEEMLFRKPVNFVDEKVQAYYRGKVILITGGGGSIGSELCRQLAKMGAKQIIILDIYENGAYDVQQELKIAYGNQLDLKIEIVSITNKRGMARVFETYHPQIVINAAAHKHVPLMEHNCLEAVENNVFGTKNLVELCEEYGAERFMMISTDKAVNPTNVMGATKRMCEMIVQSASTYGKVKYSATRFGNVLGSAGSVIPLFRKQIANGGPVTLTDKRIIRYFMTIPEASQLVLQSGAMANNGELFVLDMGQPVKILDLAESMIRLSGAGNIEIVETGLRPGEKLYEELLVKTEKLEKTANSMIFVEKDDPLSRDAIDQKLEILKQACLSDSDEAVRQALKTAVPTYRSPEEVNRDAEKSEEMKGQREMAWA